MAAQTYPTSAETGAHRPAERRTFTETKLGFKTSEFMVAVIAIAAVLVATYADGDDTLTQNDGWRYAAWIAVAYIVSRGLAKLGVREPYTDDDR
ncbi:MAG: sle [Acidimicrobiales bacterium]|jgi:hypothetical protein|nr:sle [Acidimicrobiales bacterium]